MSRSRLGPLLVAALAVVGVVVGAVLIARPDPSPAPPIGAELSADDRRVLDAPEPVRGAPPAPRDPRVDLTDPEAVARAYLAAAHGATGADAGRTHLRAAAYAVPGTPLATVGVLVVDPPPAGATRAATVGSLELAAVDRGNHRRGYLATVTTATTAATGTVTAGSLLRRYVVLERRADDRWLVAAESPATPGRHVGEDG